MSKLTPGKRIASLVGIRRTLSAKSMTFDRQSFRKSKEAHRSQLAARPIAEKLRLLDEMRAREILLRAARPAISMDVKGVTPCPN